MIKNFIEIFGCGHSGTSILNKIIGNHKNVFGIPYETGLFLIEDDHKEIIKRLEHMHKDRIGSGKKWICEKTPLHVYHIRKIFSFVESPKIIVMVRDGRDVVASLYARYRDIDKSLIRWINDNNEWLNSNYKKNFYILRYEDFVKNPTEELKSICDYLGEEFDNNILNYSKKSIDPPQDVSNEKDHRLLRFYQINQELYDGSKRYLKDLTKEQTDYLMSNNEFIKLMNHFNYI